MESYQSIYSDITALFIRAYCECDISTLTNDNGCIIYSSAFKNCDNNVIGTNFVIRI
jgi:hypothetical protein